MIINHNCCIKLVPLVIFIYYARSHIHQIRYVDLVLGALSVFFFPVITVDYRMALRLLFIISPVRSICFVGWTTHCSSLAVCSSQTSTAGFFLYVTGFYHFTKLVCFAHTVAHSFSWLTEFVACGWVEGDQDSVVQSWANFFRSGPK